MIHAADNSEAIPPYRMTAMGVTYNFKAPLSLPSFLTQNNEDDETASGNAFPQIEGLEESEPTQVTFTAGVGGRISHPNKTYKVEYEDGTEGEEKVISAVRDMERHILIEF